MSGRFRILAGALGSVGVLVLTACSGAASGGDSIAERDAAPDFTIPVVRATDGGSFATATFTLSARTDGPLILYFSFPG